MAAPAPAPAPTPRTGDRRAELPEGACSPYGKRAGRKATTGCRKAARGGEGTADTAPGWGREGPGGSQQGAVPEERKKEGKVSSPRPGGGWSPPVVCGVRHGGGTGGCLAERSCGRGLPLAWGGGGCKRNRAQCCGVRNVMVQIFLIQSLLTRQIRFFRKSSFSSIPFFLVFIHNSQASTCLSSSSLKSQFWKLGKMAVRPRQPLALSLLRLPIRAKGELDVPQLGHDCEHVMLDEEGKARVTKCHTC
ncbi:uncharacterized protein LOC115346830 [Aquila chrysaetos chrysaetos]|uniref:uncharacterized protein LOC115346830 n=1 Tax=Aquila chrysaetos chrysaetos TaxID=223781 RepID=UPI001B7D341D|nr:uncharacterized protein LOC115346830 [Aquila chrysaetos chrysaetos]